MLLTCLPRSKSACICTCGQRTDNSKVCPRAATIPTPPVWPATALKNDYRFVNAVNRTDVYTSRTLTPLLSPPFLTRHSTFRHNVSSLFVPINTTQYTEFDRTLMESIPTHQHIATQHIESAHTHVKVPRIHINRAKIESPSKRPTCATSPGAS